MSGTRTAAPDTGSAHATPAIRALLFGNFVIGTGVMLLVGMLNEIAGELGVSVPTAGQLVGVAALAMCIGAPLAAAFTSRIDRRRLLLAALALFGAGHAACALAGDFATLAVLRPISVFGAAVFTPQAAATIGLLVPAHRRSGALTTIFLGWSLASVIGMPAGSLIAGYASWRAGFVLVALLSGVAMLWISRVIPKGLRVPALSLASWLEVARSPRLSRVLAVTLLSASGQFVLLAYIAPALRDAVAASPAQLAAFMAGNGAFGVLGNALASRGIGRLGPDRTVMAGLLAIAFGLLFWALAIGTSTGWPLLALTAILWGAGSFGSNSAQQARLAASAPALSSASIALNTSGMYAGQVVGAALGGAVIALSGYAPLGWVALAFVAASIGCSWLADRASTARP